ncbi:MAG: hypothetical protein H5U40_06705, partial [Polyangiaceae bacterium]|nr:hypothetical protein [Polyangiaceae bacterium]
LAKTRALAELASRVAGPARERRFSYRFESGGLEGAVHAIDDRELFDIGHDTADKPRRLLLAWVRLLALQASTEAPCIARIVGIADGEVVERALSLEGGASERRTRALDVLEDLVALRHEGLSRPLHLFEKASFALAKELVSKKSSEDLAFARARDAWRSGYNTRGDIDDPFLALAYPTGAAPFIERGALSHDMIDLARRVYVPILEAASEGER